MIIPFNKDNLRFLNLNLRNVELLRSIIFILITYTILFFTGISKFTYIYFFVVFLFSFLKRKEIKFFRQTFLPDLLLGIFFVSILGIDVENLFELRGKLHALSPIIPPLFLYLLIEYYFVFFNLKFDFKKFSDQRTNLPLWSLAISSISIIRGPFDGNDLISIIHWTFLSIIFLFEFIRLTKDNKKDTGLKNTPLIIFIFFIFICKSKVTILTSFGLFLCIFGKFVINALYQFFKIKKNITYYFINLYKVIISISFILIITLSYNLEDISFYKNFATNRAFINNSYLQICNEPNRFPLKKEFPAFNRKSNIQSSKRTSIQLNKFQEFRYKNSLSIFLEKKLLDQEYIKRHLYTQPHLSLINYRCYHPYIFYAFAKYLILILSLTILVKFGINIFMVFISSFGIILFEYMPYLPFLCSLISSFILILLFYGRNDFKDSLKVKI